MKRQIIYLVFACIVVVPACKKDKDKTTTPSKTTAELLIGRWDLHHEAEDGNNNGTMEDAEKSIRSDFDWKFEESGAAAEYGTDNGVPYEHAFSYTLNGNELKVGSSTADLWIIEEITDSELRLKRTYAGETIWWLFTKI